VQPRLVVERVVADLVACVGNSTERPGILIARRILADHEKGDGQVPFAKDLQNARHDDVKIGWERRPTLVAVRFQIGPFVVEVQREAGQWFLTHAPASRGAARRLCVSWPSCRAARSASWIVSLTFSVPLAMWLEFTT